MSVIGTANLSRGGEAHDVTDVRTDRIENVADLSPVFSQIVHPTIRDLAVSFARVSGMGLCGADLLCTDISKCVACLHCKIFSVLTAVLCDQTCV